MIPTIKEQIDLEKRMVAFGINRYRTSVDAADEGGRSADTKHAQKLIQSFLDPISKAIEAYNAEGKVSVAGIGAKYRVLLQRIEPDKAAYFGLRAILNHFTKEEPLASLGIKIGTMIEDEIKFQKFHAEHEDYYEAIIRDFQNKGTKSYRHMHRVLTNKANEQGVEWNSWTPAEKCAVGIKVVDLILENTDLIQKVDGAKRGKRKHKANIIIKPTDTCLDWVKRFSHYAEMLNPDRVPCIIEPDDWVSLTQGGYYSPQLRSRTPLVKTKNRKHQAILEEANLETVMQAVNQLQKTPWQINTDVLPVLKMAWDHSIPLGLPQSEPMLIPTCPIPKTIKKSDMTPHQREKFENWKNEARIVHTLERERVSKCFQVIRVLRLASEFSQYQQFWFVHQCDFRGRIYSTVSGLSPQGTDFAKGLLRFAEGKPLGKAGEFWFKVHGANMYGNDKLPYADRVKWIDDNREMLEQLASDPLSYREAWANADKPWQFLAWCLEYKGYLNDGQNFVSYLPIALDGSCNGLQNFSAMLRDEVGGKATNLLPTEAPLDIYAEVSKVCTRRLREIGSPEALTWLRLAATNDGNLPRGVAKRPVMTLPYGSTRQSCREYIYKYMIEEQPDFFPKDQRFHLSVFLTPILWASINEVVIAAREAMDWVQRCAAQLGKEDHATQWMPPNGFPVYQERYRTQSRQVHTELAGHFRLRLDYDTKEIDIQKQKLGASPNFVHSMDACHLMFTVTRAMDKGITAMACIHDDFGTHAADTPKLHSCIRLAFLDLYGEHDPLKDFKTLNEKLSGLSLPAMPKKGTLDLSKIKEARYFFG